MLCLWSPPRSRCLGRKPNLITLYIALQTKEIFLLAMLLLVNLLMGW